MKEYLRFNKMISPAAIQVVFWVGVFGSVVLGLDLLNSPLSRFKYLGLACIFGMPILLRVYCEKVIVFFRIYEALKNLEKTVVPAPETISSEDQEMKTTATKFTSKAEYEKWKAGLPNKPKTNKGDM